MSRTCLLWAAAVVLGLCGVCRAQVPPAVKEDVPRVLFPVSVNGKWGYIDNGGKFVIPARFDRARPFSEGLAAVNVGGKEEDADWFEGGKWGFIDGRGKFVVAPGFEDVGDFSQGFAPVGVGGKWVFAGDTYHLKGMAFDGPVLAEAKYGFIDRTGKYLVDPAFDGAENFCEGLARVRTGRKWGFVNLEGKVVIPVKFDAAFDFHERRARVNVGGKVNEFGVCERGDWGFIDVKGDYVVKPQYDWVDDFCDGLARFNVGGDFTGDEWGAGGTWGFVDASGKVVIPTRFNHAGNFSDAVAPVAIDADWGYIDKKGSFVMKPAFMSASAFVAGLATVESRDGGFRVVDITGKVVFQKSIDGWMTPMDGLAAVRIRELWGFIDLTGKLTIQPRFVETTGFSRELAAVRLEHGGKWALIDRTGKVLVGPQFDEAIWPLPLDGWIIMH